MKSKIKIMLKESVLDPQGTTVKNALSNLGFGDVNDVRIGKYIELDLKTDNKAEAEAETKEMCDKLLANLVIESYEFEVV